LINQASQDVRFQDHPGLTKYGIESYLAVPLFRNNGEFFGTLCAMDPQPRNLSKDKFVIFELMANLIAFELEAEEQRQDREEALKLAKQTNETRARFMGILGHDLRSPLSTIMMAASIQKLSELEKNKNIEMSQKILRAANRMKYLIEDLLDTTQTVQGNEIRIVKEPSDLRKIFSLILEEFEISHPERIIEFYAEENCYGNWDEGRLGQVLSNLLSNAIHYGSSSKPIKVNLIRDDNKVILQVNNQGKIIPQEIKKNLFKPFWRGARKRSNSSGLGLGLYIVKQIVEAHGGLITVDSNPEYGTTFTVIFED
jgi:signal transduction histidine kinase